MQRPRPEDLISDIGLCIGFFTRLPVATAARDFASALWAAPVAGALVGASSGIVLLVGSMLGLHDSIAALLAIAASIALTGALHEDGAADVADGFGGGTTRGEKLDIMRDSRIGSYGTLALILSVLARWSALMAIVAAAGAGTGLVALVSAHAAARAVLPAFASHVPPARATGLSAGIGVIPQNSVLLALALGLAALFLSGFVFAIIGAAVLALLFFAIERLAFAQLGGQTGDVLGALEQLCEAALLMVLAAMLA